MQTKYRFAGVARIHPAPMARAWGAERSAGECLRRGQRGQVAPKRSLGRGKSRLELQLVGSSLRIQAETAWLATETACKARARSASFPTYSFHVVKTSVTHLKLCNVNQLS